MSSQTERTVADITAETLAVEEVALSTQSLHHIHSLGAEVANVTASEPRREVLTYHALRGTRPDKVTEILDDVFKMFLRIVVYFQETPASTQPNQSHGPVVRWQSVESCCIHHRKTYIKSVMKEKFKDGLFYE